MNHQNGRHIDAIIAAFFLTFVAAMILVGLVRVVKGRW